MPDKRAPSVGSRTQGLNTTTDTYEDVLTDGSGALLVKAQIAGSVGDSNVAIRDPITVVNGGNTAVLVNLTQSDSVFINVTASLPVTISGITTVNITNVVTVNVTNIVAISGAVNISALSPLKVDITAGLVSDIAIRNPITVVNGGNTAVLVNVTQSNSIPVQLSGVIAVDVTSIGNVNVTQSAPFKVDVTAGTINITAASPLTVNVTNVASVNVTNIASSVAITDPVVTVNGVNTAVLVNVTNTAAILVHVTQASPLSVNVTAGVINITAAQPLTVNVTNVVAISGVVNVTQAQPITVNVTNIASSIAIRDPIAVVDGANTAVLVNVTNTAAILVQVSNTNPITVNVSGGVVNITAANALKVDVTNIATVNVTSGRVNITQTLAFSVNVTAGTINVTGGVINITAAQPLTVNVTNNLNITNVVSVNVTNVYLNSGTGQNATAVTFGSGSVAQLLASNSSRRFLILSNFGDFDAWLSIGTSNVRIGEGIHLKRRGGALILDSTLMSREAIFGIGEGSASIALQEAT